ncbi:MAG: 4-hydroxy-tetrahydrodipicolinate reductase [Proteobacteria bacterium]|nr:4-hydroxy-tetrahydrodipicolinate reductase [Pseudomonadota bacterium]
MADKIKVAVMGASGRMGQALMKGVLKENDMELIGATERKGSEWVGRSVGSCLGGDYLWGKGKDVMIVEDAVDLFAKADAVIDFTSPKASVFHAELAAQAKCVLVIGTTGFDEAERAKIKIAGRHARIIQAGNMSVGVNLLASLTHQVAGALDNSFDIEVVETHHRHKVDAPSGTAIMLGNAAAQGRNVKLSDVFDRERKQEGINDPRKTGTIGFSSIRGGDIVGEHDVIFAGEGERIVLRHIATDRSIFVRGALRAVRWGIGRPAGEYNMYDVLEIFGQKLKINP